MRSLTELQGSIDSSFKTMLATTLFSFAKRPKRTQGVAPMTSTMLSAINGRAKGFDIFILFSLPTNKK
jgi:hypothetical protein